MIWGPALYGVAAMLFTFSLVNIFRALRHERTQPLADPNVYMIYFIAFGLAIFCLLMARSVAST